MLETPPPLPSFRANSRLIVEALRFKATAIAAACSTIIICSLKTNATAWTWCSSRRATRSI